MTDTTAGSAILRCETCNKIVAGPTEGCYVWEQEHQDNRLYCTACFERMENPDMGILLRDPEDFSRLRAHTDLLTFVLQVTCGSDRLAILDKMKRLGIPDPRET